MSQWDWVYLVEIKIGKFVLCQRQETYRGLTAEPAMRISGIVLLHFIFADDTEIIVDKIKKLVEKYTL
jgi:hypothetical protein